MVRETVAIDTLARSATVRISIRRGFFFAAPAADLFLLTGMIATRMRLQDTLGSEEIKKQISAH